MHRLPFLLSGKITLNSLITQKYYTIISGISNISWISNEAKIRKLCLYFKIYDALEEVIEKIYPIILAIIYLHNCTNMLL